MASLSKFKYRFNGIPNKSQETFFVETDKLILKSHGNVKVMAWPKKLLKRKTHLDYYLVL